MPSLLTLPPLPEQGWTWGCACTSRLLLALLPHGPAQPAGESVPGAPPALPRLTSLSPWHRGAPLCPAGPGAGWDQQRAASGLLTQAPPWTLHPKAHSRTGTMLHC